MPTERELVDAYTRRALQLVRVVNGLSADAQRDLRALSRELRTLLADADMGALSRRDLAALLRQVDAAVATRYATIAERNAGSLAELTAIESGWATRVGELPRAASPVTLASVSAGLLVLGSPLAEHWQRQSDNLASRISASLRTAGVSGWTPVATLEAIVGQGPRGKEKGGLLGAARTHAETLIDTSAHSAAYAGQMAAWKAGGINALKWHSILDSRTTIGCAARAGKLYTLDLEPIGHSIPIDVLPPRHWNCRSLLVGMKYPGELPPDGQDPYSESLDDWLKRHPQELQDEMLGQGKATLWRNGAITTRDLLGQNGQTLSLTELAENLPDIDKVKLWAGDAKYQRLAGELTPEMRAAGAEYGLAEHHMVAVRHYTEDGFEALNASLREGASRRSTVAAGVLNEALDRLPVYHGTVVRRATLDAEALAKHTPGAIVDYPAFTSATSGARDVFSHRPHRLVIHGRTGRDVSTWSAYSQSELEVLFGVPRRFFVKDRKDFGTYIEIILEELP